MNSFTLVLQHIILTFNETKKIIKVNNTVGIFLSFFFFFGQLQWLTPTPGAAFTHRLLHLAHLCKHHCRHTCTHTHSHTCVMAFTPEHIFAHERVSLSHYAVGGALTKTFSSLFSRSRRLAAGAIRALLRESIKLQKLLHSHLEDGEKRESVWERERGDSEEISGTSSSLTHNTNHISGSANNEAASASRWSRDSSPAAVLAARNVVINHDLEIIASLSQLIKLSGTHLSSSDGDLDPFITTLFAFFMTAAATPFESCAAFSFLFFFNWEELHV